MKEKIIDRLAKGLVVSCQALEDEPLHSSFIMSRMAVAAEQEGAVGIRANSVSDIQEIKQLVDIPIIGIIKQDYPDSEVFITPTKKEVRLLCNVGVEIIALDATLRDRPNKESLKEIVEMVRKEYPEVLLMADTSSIEDVENACEMGFDFIGTTLYGYTPDTDGKDIADNDFAYLKEVIKKSTIPVIAEGKINTPEKAKKVLELGCLCVVVGSAITRPQLITRSYMDAIKHIRK